MKTREHVLYPAIYAAVEALPPDDDISGFDRVRELLTLLRDNRPPDTMIDFHAAAAHCASIYSSYLIGDRPGWHHRKERKAFLDHHREVAA